MKFTQKFLRECALWRQYPRERLRCRLRRPSNLDTATFVFKGVEYTYFIHPYNRTWRNERAIEIPVIWDGLQGVAADDILEVGNVLSHYFDIQHQVIDKWERCWYYKGVINHDLLSWNSDRQFRVIVSISTIEHIGWDDTPRNPDIVFDVFPRLRSMLLPAGKAIVTVPIGQNPSLDQGFRDHRIDVSEQYFFQRISRENEWQETTLEQALACRYAHPFPNANALAFLIIHGSSEGERGQGVN